MQYLERLKSITWPRFLELIRHDAFFFEELGRKRAIEPYLDDGALKVRVFHDRVSPSGLARLQMRFPNNADGFIQAWFCAEIAAHGPKVFQPTLDQCFALEHIAPKITLADYAQPYPVMAIDLPERYRQQRTCPSQSGLFVGEHRPEFVLVGFPPGDVRTLWLHIGFSSGTHREWVMSPTDETIEDGLLRTFGKDSYDPVDQLTPDECTVIAGSMRVGVNAMLVMMHYGQKRLGPANEAHYNRLQHHLTVARKRGNRIAEAERDLRLAPQLYGFDQEIVLHEEARTDRGEHDHTGLHLHPHWRRGHWQMQVHGPNRALRKRILKKPTFVNRHLLASDGGAGQTTYRIK
jgi:hypothetical protein